MVVFTAKPLELRNDKILVLSFPSQRDVDALKERSAPGEGVGDYLKKAFVHVLGFEPALMAKVEGTSAAPPAAAPQQSAPAPAASPAHVSASEPSTQPRSSNQTPAAADEGPETEEPAPAEDREPGGWAVAAIPESEPESEADPSMARSGAAAALAKQSEAPAANPAPSTEAPASTSPTPAAEVPATAPDARPSISAAAAQMDRSRYGESVVRELLNATFIEEQQVAPRVTPQPRDE